MQATGQKNDKLKGWVAKDSPFFQKYSVDLSTPLLGDGSYSVCRKCIHRQTGREYAVKIISTQKKDIKQEIELLKACQGCPYIITLHEVFHDSAFTYIVTELAAGGELGAQLSTGLPEGLARRLLAQLAFAVRHMHARRTVHRDLKPENILLTSSRISEAKVKVVDFGFARRAPECEERQRMMTPCFSLPYAAPEVVSRARSCTAPGYGPQCDLWSLGVIFYCMLSGKAPFQPMSKKEPVTAFMDRIRAGSFTMDGAQWDKVSSDSKRMVASLLSVDPNNRPTTSDILADLGVNLDENVYFKLADMTKADLYKRRYKNKQRKSSSEPSTSTDMQVEQDEPKEMSLLETINNLKNRMNKNSIDNDVELIKANTQDTPVSDDVEPNYNDIDDVPSVKPVEKTYAKSRSKLDDYIYIESSQGLEGTEVAFPKGSRAKNAKDAKSPVPRKRRKVETRQSKKETNGRELRSKIEKNTVSQTPPVEGRALRSKSITEKTRVEESIENEKTVATKATRKRKYADTAKPVLQEKGQNVRSSRKNSAVNTTERKTVRAKRNKTQLNLNINEPQNVRMTRSRTRRLEISLSPSQVKSIVPAFSFESDRRVNSIESNRSAKSANAKTRAKPRKQPVTKAKKTPVRATRSRANRR